MLVPECRICLEDSSNEIFISPCRCSGTSGFVHESCLQKWREECKSTPEKYNKCELCQEEYLITRMNPKESFFITKNENLYKMCWFSLCSISLISITTGGIDSLTNKSSIGIIGLGPIENKLNIELDTDPWCTFSYYVSLGSFSHSILMLFMIKCLTSCFVKQYFRYNKLMLFNDLFYILSMVPYPLLIYIMRDLGIIALLCSLGIFTIFINTPITILYFKRHDIVLDKINLKYIHEKIMNVVYNPIDSQIENRDYDTLIELA